MLLYHSSAQQIQLNEVVSSNSIFYDEDQQSPDWFELHNPTTASISLEGWTISDKTDNPSKWVFPNITLQPDQYLVIWASGKDRTETSNPRTIINQGDFWKYRIPTEAVETEWVNIDFNDSNWLEGPSGFGYSDNDDATQIPNGTASVFMRKEFYINTVTDIEELILDIDYDDSFVAYINGVEVARENIEGNRPAYNATSITDHEAQMYSGGNPDRFVISPDVLQNGENVLSIQAHNVSSFSSDFSLIPFLSAFFSTPTTEGIAPPEILNLNSKRLHTNFKLLSEETLSLYDNAGNEVDQILIQALPPDVSLGRRTLDNVWIFFETPTPGMPNTGSGFEGYVSDKILFSHPGGITGPIELTLSGGLPNDKIRYTLDASIPNQSSPAYNGPIMIDETSVVRAKIFRFGFIPSATFSKTYLQGVNHELPIVTLVTEPDNLFDNEYGIYELGDSYQDQLPFFGANFWEDWERDIHFSLYENDNSLGIELNAGVKIFGGWSRAQDQRSFSIFARGKYGTSEIDYPLFPNNAYETYQALVLRNAGNDFLRSNLRDGMMTTLMAGSGLERQAYRPVATYINGEYWGFYNMREKVNEHFLASKFDVDPNEIDLMGPFGELIHGDNADYIALHQYLENNSLSSDINYQYVADRIDIDNFIIYNVAQIFFNNTDWPGNNIKHWKPKGGKWRWILYDTDFGFAPWNPNSYFNNTLSFALEPNGPNWPNPPASTLLLRRLVENIDFRHQFINLFADELNSRFLSERVEEHIESTAEVINTEVESHYDRWNGSIDFYNDQIEVMINFANFRPSIMKSHLREVFNLPAYFKLTLQTNDLNKGYIKVNSLSLDQSPWIGDYFNSVPIKVTALARPGYRFSHWEGDQMSIEQELTIDMQSAMSLTAVFEVSTEEQIAIINEINYKSLDTKDAGDWIELYNLSEEILDVSGWTITDNDIIGGFTLPEGTLVSGNNFLVIVKDQEKFENQHPEINNWIDNLSFGLSSEGETLLLYNDSNELIDSVQYGVETPWSEMANGQGYTLELIAPELDNSLSENWESINEGGSPGAANKLINSINEKDHQQLNLFPNPFDQNGTIEFELLNPARVKITMHSADGKLLKTLKNERLIEGIHTLNNDFKELEKGVYFIKFEMEQYQETRKWVKN